MEVLQTLLKVAKRCKTKQAVKDLMPLTGLIHFVKLHAKYLNHPNCRTPTLSASLKAAQQLGRGPYVARKLRQMEPYVLKYRQLPPTKKHAGHRQITFLDNENVKRGIREYFTVLKIGEITPFKFLQQVNNVILPSLGLPGPPSHISESTAVRWLHKLGYQNTKVKKGIYIDGHEPPDVIDMRKILIMKVAELCRYDFRFFLTSNSLNYFPVFFHK